MVHNSSRKYVTQPDSGQLDGAPLSGADRVLAALKTLAAYPDGVALEELARQLKSPKSSTHRALMALRRAGLAEQDERARYRLGLEYVRLAFEYYETRDDHRIVEPVLKELSRRLTATAHYAVLDGSEIVYLAKVNPERQAVRMTSTVGGRNPAHCTALGKALMAYTLMDYAAVKRYSAEYGPLTRRTPNTLATATKLARDLRETRDRGYALDRQESELGIVCIAFPVFLDQPHSPTAAVSVSALAPQLPLKGLMDAADEIRNCIHQHLGPVTPTPGQETVLSLPGNVSA